MIIEVVKEKLFFFLLRAAKNGPLPRWLFTAGESIIMKIVNQAEFNKAKNTYIVEIECSHCGVSHKKRKSTYISSRSKGRKKSFCSIKCTNLHRFNQLEIDKEKLIRLFNEGYSSHLIAKELKRGQTSVQYWINKLNLVREKILIRRKNKTSYIRSGYRMTQEEKIENLRNRYNWQEIQIFYDSGKTWKDIRIEYKVSLLNLSIAAKEGFFKTRKAIESYLIRNPNRIGRKQSSESKQKLSVARKAYLAANPDKHAWKLHNKFKSIPCEKVKTDLRRLEIGFDYEFQPLLHLNRFFSVDISFPNRKIGFEINGGQHYKGGELAPYYQKRHDLIVAEGWTLYEIPYHVAMRKNFAEDFIIKILEGAFPVNYDTKLYVKKGLREKGIEPSL